jgi:transcriptional regulator with XRE-family HTH domain
MRSARQPFRRLRSVGIRQLRERTGLTQADVAKLIGVQTSTVNRWERGHDVPTTANRRRLARLFKVPVAELEFGD